MYLNMFDPPVWLIHLHLPFCVGEQVPVNASVAGVICTITALHEMNEKLLSHLGPP